MVLIKNRDTGLYDRKGLKGREQWTDKSAKRGVWGTIGQAKSHICQFLNYKEYYVENILRYANADFLVLDDEYSQVEIIPVKDYIIHKTKEYIKEHETRGYYKEEVSIANRILTMIEN